MNNAALDPGVVRKTRKYNGRHKKNGSSWPLYTGTKPTLEELDESIKSLSFSDMRHILENAGIIDKEGNITEIYRL